MRRSLVVGAVDDPAEREADAIAAGVLQTLSRAEQAPAPPFATDAPTRIRRAPSGEHQVDELDEVDADGEDVATDAPVPDTDVTGATERADTDSDEVRRAPAPRISRSATAGASAGPAGTGAAGGELDAGIADRIQRLAGGGRPIEAPVRDRIQAGFATDLTSVRVHRDGEAAQLSRDVNARAFTVGNDVFFGAGEYRPASASGMELFAHELAHVEQQSSGRVGRRARRTVIRRRFQPAVTLSKAHLRDKDAWDAFKGPAIASGSGIYLDDDPAARVVQHRKVLKDVTWVPAVNADPNQLGPVAANRIGYIRAERAARFTTMPQMYRREVLRLLRDAERRVPDNQLTGKLATQEHVDFLMDKAIRFDVWNPDQGAKGDSFASGIGTLQAKLDRIKAGAEHVADSLAYWREWLFPGYPELVDIVEIKLLGSDLHEHGLGVVSAKFKKLLTGGQAMFSDKKIVETIIKPEDKSLEQSLLGSQPDSAVNQINQLAGLTGNEQIGTLNMKAANIANGGVPVWSTLVERVQGVSSEKFAEVHGTAKGQGAHGVIPAFHETLVFAFLAGIDDLHWENVMWVNDVPYLIDADNVMMHSQMTKTGTGDANQSGFSTINKAESDESREGIKALDPARAKSKLLDKMLNDDQVRDDVLDAIKGAIRGHKGRTVPIFTDRWATLLRNYQTTPSNMQDGFTTFYAARTEIVREGRAIDSKIGPGLSGTTGINTVVPFYDAAAEKAEMEKDFAAGVIPFYEYHYDTGHVTHNGVKIFHGLTLDQAFAELATKLGA